MEKVQKRGSLTESNKILLTPSLKNDQIFSNIIKQIQALICSLRNINAKMGDPLMRIIWLQSQMNSQIQKNRLKDFRGKKVLFLLWRIIILEGEIIQEGWKSL